MVRVKSMAMKAFPMVDAETRQQLAVPHFIRALNNKLLEQSIWAATPTTLSRALEVALACENGLRSSTDTSQATARPAPKVRQVITDESYEQNESAGMLDAVRAVTAGLEKRLDKHEQTINRKLNDFTKKQLATATQGKDANVEASDRGVKCYGCGKLGHVKRDCRGRKMTEMVQWRTGKGSSNATHAVRSGIWPKSAQHDRVETGMADRISRKAAERASWLSASNEKSNLPRIGPVAPQSSGEGRRTTKQAAH
jgi:hypothetical protein